MPSPVSSPLGHASRPLRIGFLSLTDSAPLVVAEALGVFARHGLHVELRREIGWATIREKIIYGELDAAQAPAPMLWATKLGVGCRPTDVLTAFVMSLHGNALTLSRTLWEAGARDASTLRAAISTRSPQSPLTFGAVFPFSSHNIMLREWLRTAGLEPERNVRVVIVPPAQMFRNLAAGTIDGFCSGEPWNSVAVREGAGWCPTWSAAQNPGHVEKVLMVTKSFAETRAAEHSALVRALAEAAAWCDEPHHREQLADLLSGAGYLNLPTRVIAPALTGRFDCGNGRIENVPDFHVFHRGNANVPSADKALAVQQEIISAGLLPVTTPDTTYQSLFREDLYHEILRTLPHANHSA